MVFRNINGTEPIGGNFGEDGIKDRRARLSPKPDAYDLILGPSSSDNILNPIRSTNGLMWPYSPVISDDITVNYDTYDLVHSNQPILAYKNTGLKEIGVSGTFTAQNQQEAKYCLAAIHFLRSVTKMFFGATGENNATRLRGTPPPILLFNAYGTAMYHNLPVVVTQCSMELPNDVDYVKVDYDAGVTTTDTTSEGTLITNINANQISGWVPTKFNIIARLAVQNSPKRLRRFNLDDFRQGNLIKKGGWV